MLCCAVMCVSAGQCVSICVRVGVAVLQCMQASSTESTLLRYVASRMAPATKPAEVNSVLMILKC